MSDTHDKQDIIEHLNARNGLRIISTPERKPPPPDPEIKALLDDMRRRQRVMHERLEDKDDTPDSA